jgi:hypothetical protein
MIVCVLSVTLYVRDHPLAVTTSMADGFFADELP